MKYYPKRLRPLALLVLAIITLAGGMAFAVLQSSPGLVKGNVIQTAVASLQVSPNGITYSDTMDGYVFGSLVPGGQPMPLSGYPIYVKNVGTTPLALKLSVKAPLSNPDNVDLSKVHVILTPVGGGAQQNLLLQDLINTTIGVTVNQAIHIIPTQVFQLTLQVSMEADALNGPSATLSNVDFVFGALAVN